MKVQRQKLYAAIKGPELAVQAKSIVKMPKPVTKVSNTIVPTKSSVTKDMSPQGQIEAQKLQTMKETTDRNMANQQATLDKQKQQLIDERQKLMDQKKAVDEQKKLQQTQNLLQTQQRTYSMRIPRQRCYSNKCSIPVYCGNGTYRVKRFSALTLEERMYMRMPNLGIRSSINAFNNQRKAGLGVLDSFKAVKNRNSVAKEVKSMRSARDVVNQNRAEIRNLEAGRNTLQNKEVKDAAVNSAIEHKTKAIDSLNIQNSEIQNQVGSKLGSAGDISNQMNSNIDSFIADRTKGTFGAKTAKIEQQTIAENTANAQRRAQQDAVGKQLQAEEAAAQKTTQQGTNQAKQATEQQATQQVQQAEQQVQQAQQQVEQATGGNVNPPAPETPATGGNVNQPVPETPAAPGQNNKSGGWSNMSGWKKAGIIGGGVAAAGVGTGLYMLNSADNKIKEGVDKTLNMNM